MTTKRARQNDQQPQTQKADGKQLLSPHAEEKNAQGDLLRRTFSLTMGVNVELRIVSVDSGKTWNGYAVPILTAAQAEAVGFALGEPYIVAGESAGLAW